MTNETAQSPTNSQIFPSEQFLNKYFAPDVALDFNPHRGEIPTRLHEELRRCIQLIFLSLPMYQLKATYRANEDLKRVYVYEAGQLADWIDSALNQRGLPEFTPEANAELMVELSNYCLHLMTDSHQWWQWKVEGDSIWLEVIPEAIAAGENKRRTLADILKSDD